LQCAFFTQKKQGHWVFPLSFYYAVFKRVTLGMTPSLAVDDTTASKKGNGDNRFPLFAKVL
jgi:hypothetical protein